MTTQDPELSAALGWPGGISDPVLDRVQLLRMVAALMQDTKYVLMTSERGLAITPHVGTDGKPRGCQ